MEERYSKVISSVAKTFSKSGKPESMKVFKRLEVILNYKNTRKKKTNTHTKQKGTHVEYQYSQVIKTLFAKLKRALKYPA